MHLQNASKLMTFWFLLCALWLSATNTMAEDELLDVDQAFQLQPVEVQGDKLLISWKIAEHYHLYKERISLNSNNLTLSPPAFSAGKMVDDIIFGRTEVFENNVTVTQVYSGSAKETELTIKYQGCADKQGVCYPPQTRKVSVKLPPATTSPSGFNSLSELNNLLVEDSGSDLLPADEAFAFQTNTQNGQVQLHWQIAHGYHIYRDKIKITTLTGSADVSQLKLPKAETINDPVFGKTTVYHDNITATLTPANVTSPTEIQIEYQGCSADAGVCYPPEKHIVKLDPQDFSGNAVQATSASAPSEQSETDQITDTLKNSSVWVILGTFFLFGLLLALTPCVFPMIPILSSIIVGQGDKLSTQKAFVMSVVYVLAMSITYTVAGVLAGLFGENLQAAFQNPWIIGSFSLIFVALAFSMFGFFELKLPNGLQSKITNISNKQEGGTLTGVAVMGFLSALIVGPCVAPPLAGALIYIGQTGDALLGGSALFVMSLGMGLPLILLGTSAGKLLPRAGTWMNQVTRVFGVIMLAIAVWMASRILPVEITNLLWATLLIGSALYMGVFESTQNKGGWQKAFQTLGFLFVLYGSLIIIGLAAGSQSLLKPLDVFKGGSSAQAQQTESLVFQRVKTLDDLKAQLASAKASGQTVMLDFYADWCVSCKEMEHITFVDSQVTQALNNTLLLQADVTANDAEDKALMKAFGIIGPPAILFFKEGEEQKAQRVVGFKDPQAFLNNIHKAFD